MNLENYNINCGKGWYKLIEPIISYIEKYNSENKNKIYLCNAYSQFGGLIVEVYNSTKELDKIINECEASSFYICEKCGSKEHIGTSSYNGKVYTICKDCMQKIVNENKIKGEWVPEEIEPLTIYPEL